MKSLRISCQLFLYHTSRETTLENILAAMPYMDEDMRQLAAAAVNKLQAMTDSEFSEREFILTDEE